MKINRIKIRGAIGLKPYGDKVEIDFTRFDQGPIAIVGNNRAGKRSPSGLINTRNPLKSLR